MTPYKSYRLTITPVSPSGTATVLSFTALPTNDGHVGEYEFQVINLNPSTTYTFLLIGIDSQGRDGMTPTSSLTLITSASDARLDSTKGIFDVVLTTPNQGARTVIVTWKNGGPTAGTPYTLINVRLKCIRNGNGDHKLVRKQYFKGKNTQAQQKTFHGIPKNTVCFVLVNALFGHRRQGVTIAVINT
jgi:hypothetical protein